MRNVLSGPKGRGRIPQTGRELRTKKSRIEMRVIDHSFDSRKSARYSLSGASEKEAKDGKSFEDFSVGVLFENSIVCHVFYAIWSWGLCMVGFCLLCVVFGACFVLVCLASAVVGVGWGYVVWFSGLFLTVALAGCWLVGVLLVLFGEFDPGSGRTLAACLTHASRTVKRLPLWWVWMSGERVSNT